MSKRKRETADEEPLPSRQLKRANTQKTNTTRAPRARALSNAAPIHAETKGPTQLLADRKSGKLARKTAKREKRALEKPQRDRSRRKDGVAKEGNGDAKLLETTERTLSERGQTAPSQIRDEGLEREKEGGQKLSGKHNTKKVKHKDKTVRPNGKKSKTEVAAETATWKVSDSVGGQMLDVDPVFSPDEK